MDILWISFIGGLFGAVLMDITEMLMFKFGISSGVKGVYIGRWIAGMLKGVFIHRDIASSSAAPNEARIGQLFHFIVGGGVVGAGYPVFLAILGLDVSANHLIFATIYGFFTSLLPWFILMPCFGWGVFGVRAPTGSKPIVSPIISHTPFGLGVGITLMLILNVYPS